MAAMLTFFAICATVVHSKNTKRTQPNILFIMADDLGWGNVAWPGHNTENPEINTPNLDGLVADGLLLNRHYVDMGCSPTRASFQTGRVPIHVTTNNDDGLEDPTHGIPAKMTTVASKLKEAGYGTHLVGKWDCGFSTYSKIPTNKGYDTFYGYLSKSIAYFTKLADNDCEGTPYSDLWENGAPAYPSMDYIDDDLYIEYVFRDRVQSLIEEYGTSSDSTPFFIMYSMHLVHYPSEVPEDFLESFDNDENMCAIDNGYVYPGFEDPNLFKCRSILQSQVHLMDYIVGQIIDTLKANDLYDNTLIVFASDNGGSLEMSETAGNNYPLRGGKASFWEGGIRSASFVSGGFLPESRRGQIETGLMHIADWYTTFCALAGVDATDNAAVVNGLPAVDGLDMWPLISGTNRDSPRKVVPIAPHTVIYGNYKLVNQQQGWAVFQEPIWPNADTPSEEELKTTYVGCEDEGCLYDVVNDPSEYNELSDTHPAIKQILYQQMEALAATEYVNTDTGDDSCPDSLDESVLYCGCWMAENNYNFFVGPYQDLTPDQITFSIDSDELYDEVKKESNGTPWRGEMRQSNYYAYLSIFSLLFIGIIGFVKCFNPIHSNKISNGASDSQGSYGAMYS